MTLTRLIKDQIQELIIFYTLHIIHITICSVIKPYQVPRNKSHKRYEKIAENYKALSREINET